MLPFLGSVSKLFYQLLTFGFHEWFLLAVVTKPGCEEQSCNTTEPLIFWQSNSDQTISLLVREVVVVVGSEDGFR